MYPAASENWGISKRFLEYVLSTNFPISPWFLRIVVENTWLDYEKTKNKSDSQRILPSRRINFNYFDILVLQYWKEVAFSALKKKKSQRKLTRVLFGPLNTIITCIRDPQTTALALADCMLCYKYSSSSNICFYQNLLEHKRRLDNSIPKRRQRQT